MAMRALGVVVLVSATTGSYLAAGVAAAGVTASQAAASPLWARATERRSIRVAALISGPLVMCWTGLVIYAAHSDVPVGLLVLLAALLGASTLPVGAVSRSVWRRVAPPDVHDSAFALEGIQDEVAYVLGPALVVSFDVFAFPGAGILVAGVLHMFGVLNLGRLIAQRVQAASDSHPMHNSGVFRVISRAGIPSVVLGYPLTGVFLWLTGREPDCAGGSRPFRPACGLAARDVGFGQHRSRALVWAGILGSSVACGACRGCGAVALLTVPLLMVNDPQAAGAVLIAAGFFVSPILISANSLVASLVRRAKLL